MDQHRAIAAVGRCDEAQPAALLSGRKSLLLVTRRQILLARLDPDLQEMHCLGTRRIEFTVRDARAGTHALHVAGPNARTIAERVLVREFAREHVAQYLHVPMRVRAKAGSRRNTIFIDDAQWTEFDELRIVVIGKRKAMEGFEPTVIGKPAFLAASNGVHR